MRKKAAPATAAVASVAALGLPAATLRAMSACRRFSTVYLRNGVGVRVTGGYRTAVIGQLASWRQTHFPGTHDSNIHHAILR